MGVEGVQTSCFPYTLIPVQSQFLSHFYWLPILCSFCLQHIFFCFCNFLPLWNSYFPPPLFLPPVHSPPPNLQVLIPAPPPLRITIEFYDIINNRLIMIWICTFNLFTQYRLFTTEGPLLQILGALVTSVTCISWGINFSWVTPMTN